MGKLNPKTLDSSQFETGKVKERNEAYFNKYPEHMQRVKNIGRNLESEKITPLGSGTLSVL